MTMLRRWCAIGLATAMVGVFTSGLIAAGSAAPAGASTPEAFAGSASAQALKLDLFGTNLTLGSTSAEADTTPQAKANGAGVALITATKSAVAADSSNPNPAPVSGCGTNIALSTLLNLALACSHSSGSVGTPGPTAVSTANIADLDVGVLNTVLQLLQPILNALTPLANQLVGTVLNTVTNLLGGLGLGTTVNNLLGGLGISTTQPVSDLITALERATNLATVHVGDSGSAVTTTGGSVVATSNAQGATVDVLPGIQLNGGPLLEIIVGKASTTSTFDRGTGTSSATFNPAILEVKLLGIDIPVTLGKPIVLFPGTVLQSTISLGAGSTTKNPDGSVTAKADGVSLDLLQGLNGGISLALANAESAVGGTVATPDVVTTTTTVAPHVVVPTTVPKLLATTGSDTPFLPIGFALLLLGFFSRRYWLRRRPTR